jgi:hypothetical protein
MTQPPSESANETSQRPPARRDPLVRELISLAATGAGLVGAVVCLVHLGWWVTGLVLAVGVFALGMSGTRRPLDSDAGPQEHVIEIRHTDGPMAG